MKRMCIVPFTKAEYPLVPFLEERFTISALITPPGIGLDGQDISILLNRGVTGHRMTNSLEEGINGSDVVLVADISHGNKSLYEYMKEALTLAVTKGKDVICCSSFSQSEISSFSKICANKGGQWVYLSEDNNNFHWRMEVNTILPPVFYIAEMIPGCDGYEVFLSLAKMLEARGVRVLAISNDKYNTLFGLECFDWDVDAPFDQKGIVLNNIVHSLVEKKHPDCILVKLPYPLIKYDDNHQFDLGIMGDYITSAIPGSGCVFCTLSGMTSNDFWQGFGNGITFKYGFPVTAIHLSNRIIDSTVSSDLNLVCIPHGDIQSALQIMQRNISIPTFDLTLREDLLSLSRWIKENYIDLRFGVI